MCVMVLIYDSLLIFLFVSLFWKHTFTITYETEIKLKYFILIFNYNVSSWFIPTNKQNKSRIFPKAVFKT